MSYNNASMPFLYLVSPDGYEAFFFWWLNGLIFVENIDRTRFLFGWLSPTPCDFSRNDQ